MNSPFTVTETRTDIRDSSHQGSQYKAVVRHAPSDMVVKIIEGHDIETAWGSFEEGYYNVTIVPSEHASSGFAIQAQDVKTGEMKVWKLKKR